MRHTIAIASLALGCATAPPAELVGARQAYEQARSGPAAQLAPKELAASHTLLAQAEENYNEHPDSPKVRDYAYAADRQAHRAESLAGAEIAKQEKTKAEADLLATQAAQLSQERARTENEKIGRDRAEEKLAEETAAERIDRKARAAMESLTQMALVSEEGRGTVVTIDNDVLFAVDGSTILSVGESRLDALADAVKGRMVIVQCAGDAAGPETFRQWLANQRAASVRAHLIARGVPADHIRATGLGTLPASPNVEIIIQR